MKYKQFFAVPTKVWRRLTAKERAVFAEISYQLTNKHFDSEMWTSEGYLKLYIRNIAANVELTFDETKEIIQELVRLRLVEFQKLEEGIAFRLNEAGIAIMEEMKDAQYQQIYNRNPQVRVYA